MRLVPFGVSALLALTLSPIHGAALAQPAQTGAGPRFEDAPCPFDASAEVLDQLRCGWLVVPQSRAEPDGRQLRLAVAVLKSTSQTPRPDPIVFLSGGPGGKSVAYMPPRTRSPFWGLLRSKRDVVFFDQRGTGFSEPAFCPEVSEAYFRMNFLGWDAARRSEHAQAVLGRCAEAMREQGVDLSQFNTAASALDLQDLRRALGVGQWNLFGVSYGTTLALEAMRTDPEGIRSALLDGPAPPNARYEAERAANFADVVSRLAAACASDADCHRSHPDLDQAIWRTVEALHEAPWIIPGGSRAGLPDPMVLDGNLFAAGVFQGLYERQFLQVLPLFVQEVERRNAALVLAAAGPLSGPNQDISWGMNLAVQCYEVIPFNGPEQRQATRGRYPEILDRVAFGAEFMDLAACDAWHPYRASPDSRQPVSSAIPTLVFTGEFDPVTHRDYGPLTVATLSNGTAVDVPAMGHGVSPFHACTRGMLQAFFDQPDRVPDRSCIDGDMPPLRFVTDVRVVPGISRVAGMMGSQSPPVPLLAAVGLSLLVLAGSLLGWALAAAMGRLRRQGRRADPPFQRRAHWGAAAFSAVALAYVAGLAYAIRHTAADNPMILVFGLRENFSPVLWLPWLLLPGSLGLVAVAVLAWWRGAWSRWGRVHFSAVALSGVVVVATVFGLGLV
ncbi:MAG: alpha/beta fold hydrolase [Lysobacteraceae bacterium]